MIWSSRGARMRATFAWAGLKRSQRTIPAHSVRELRGSRPGTQSLGRLMFMLCLGRPAHDAGVSFRHPSTAQNPLSDITHRNHFQTGTSKRERRSPETPLADSCVRYEPTQMTPRLHDGAVVDTTGTESVSPKILRVGERRGFCSLGNEQERRSYEHDGGGEAMDSQSD